MKRKKRLALFMILSITQLFIAVFIVVKREDFIYLFPAKEPQTLRDLAYDRDKRLGYTVLVKEDGKRVPYLVLTKNYIGQGHVLLFKEISCGSAYGFSRRLGGSLLWTEYT